MQLSLDKPVFTLCCFVIGFALGCLYSLLMFCPDEDCSPAVETSEFDMFASQFVVGRKRTRSI